VRDTMLLECVMYEYIGMCEKRTTRKEKGDVFEIAKSPIDKISTFPLHLYLAEPH